MKTNPFHALAQALWSRGDDGEDIARDLAAAFREVVREARPEATPEQELTRLLSETGQ